MKTLSTSFLIFIGFLISILWGGNSFFDFPQLFEGILIAKFGVTSLDVEQLYSLAAVPTMIMVPLSSYLIAFIGLGTNTVIFVGVIYLGILACYLGVYFEMFSLILLGRVIFGAAYECTFVAQASFTEKWFYGRNLSLAFAVNRVMSYLGASCSAYLCPELFLKYRSMTNPFYFYLSFIFVIFFLSFVLKIMDSRYEHLLTSSAVQVSEEGASTTNLMIEENQDQEIDEKFELKDLKKISSMSWLLAIGFALFSSCYYQFTNMATDLLVNRYSLGYQDAKNHTALIPIFATVLIPIFSVILNKIGKKALALVLGTVLGITVYLYMMTLPLTGTSDLSIVLSLLGIAGFWSLLCAAVWTSYSLSLPKPAVPFMMGMIIVIQNFGFSFLPLVFGVINKKRNYQSYQNSLCVLTGMCVLSFVIFFIIYLKDIRGDRLLDMPENNKEVQEIRARSTSEFSAKGLDYKSLRTKSEAYEDNIVEGNDDLN